MAESKDKSIFETLYPVDVNGNTEKKGKLTYLSWAWAWAEVKKRYPTANYKVIKNEQGWIYHTDGRTCWVEVSVTINDLTHEEILPVMDYNNKSIQLERVTSFDANTAIQRAVTKCISRFGLGLYIYAGEDLPEDVEEPKAEEQKPKGRKTAEKRQPIQDAPLDSCCICGKTVTDYTYTDPKTGKQILYKADQIIKKSTEKFGAPICYECMAKKAAADRQKGEKA